MSTFYELVAYVVESRARVLMPLKTRHEEVLMNVKSVGVHVDRLSRKRHEDLMSETGKARRRTGHPRIELLGRPRPWAVMPLRKEEYNHI
ncbi:hypothetical protein TNCV_1604191 [Trichonephila clavipes]|nr:hypothetical protein TNCV_1604191 [Trichonephila clavipes]